MSFQNVKILLYTEIENTDIWCYFCIFLTPCRCRSVERLTECKRRIQSGHFDIYMIPKTLKLSKTQIFEILYAMFKKQCQKLIFQITYLKNS